MKKVKEIVLSALEKYWAGLKTKVVLKSNIINNLTSTSTDAPLSASQGKVLKGDIDSLNENKLDKTGRITGGKKEGTTVGQNSTAEGQDTTASGKFGAHSEGYKTVASGDMSHVEGRETTASGENSHAEGHATTASGKNAHAEGGSAKAQAENDHAEGCGSIANSGDNVYPAHAEGYQCEATNTCTHAEGYQTKSTGGNSHSEGAITKASGSNAHAEGNYTVASGESSHAEGQSTTASGESSHAEGFNTESYGTYSHARGFKTFAGTYGQTAIGRFNVKNNTGKNMLSDWLIIGNGGSDEARSNAFRVANDGTTFGKGAFQTSGADYAEYFEWLDGNQEGEDRRGYFVTLEGDKIRKATTADTYILGIVSATPVVVGNSDPDDWHGRFLRDIFGNYLKEMIEEEYEDENGEKQKRMIESYVVNPEFDSSKSYTPRAERQEWSPVGMLGQLIVRDDGTCEVNGYCCPNDDGIATMSQAGYRVIERVTDNLVKVIFK